MSVKKTLEQFKSELSVINNNITIIDDEYNGTNIKIKTRRE